MPAFSSVPIEEDLPLVSKSLMSMNPNQSGPSSYATGHLLRIPTTALTSMTPPLAIYAVPYGLDITRS